MGEVDSSTLLSVMPTEKSRVREYVRVSVPPLFKASETETVLIYRKFCIRVALLYGHSSFMYLFMMFLFIFSLWRTSLDMTVHTPVVTPLNWVEIFKENQTFNYSSEQLKI